MKFIIGAKQNMTQVFKDDGTVVPVTRITAGPCVVTQIKTKAKDKVDSVQLGFGSQRTFRLNQPKKGHLKDIKVGNDENLTVRFLRDFRIDEKTKLNRGDVFTAKVFKAGDVVQVTGESKGRGYQGVVKRHGFAGGRGSHGDKDQLRMSGSIGATGPQRVMKGKRMAGRMGGEQITIKNLEIVAVDAEKNELLIKGAVPGSRNGLLLILSNDGEMEVEVKTTPVEVKQEETVAEVTN